MKFHNRGFLNKESGMAAFEYEVSIDEDFHRDYPYVQGDFTLSDCNRQVSLDFCIHEDKDIEEKLEKIQLLIRELCIFKKQLGMAAEVFMEQEARKKVKE